MVDDDEVEGEEGAAPDVDDLEAGEGEHGELVHLVQEVQGKSAPLSALPTPASPTCDS